MGSCISTGKVTDTRIKRRFTRKSYISKKAIPKALKKMVWDKYVGPDVGQTKCLCCKHQDIRQIEFHCGHVIAEANKGKTDVHNLRPICAQCNLSMGKMDMNEFINKYMKN